jgi:hypothetical protein
MKTEILVTVSGPVGSGKTTICQIIQAALEGCGMENKFIGNELLDEEIPRIGIASRVSTLSDKVSVKILSKTLNRSPSIDGVKFPIDLYITKLNDKNDRHKHITFLAKDANIDNISNRDMMMSSLVIQETNIKNTFYLHKSRYLTYNKFVSCDELVTHLQDYYEY